MIWKAPDRLRFFYIFYLLPDWRPGFYLDDYDNPEIMDKELIGDLLDTKLPGLTVGHKVYAWRIASGDEDKGVCRSQNACRLGVRASGDWSPETTHRLCG